MKSSATGAVSVRPAVTHGSRSANVSAGREATEDKREALRAFAARAQEAGRVALSIVRSTREPMRARLAGIGLAVEAGRAVYVPVEGAHLDATDALPAARVLEALRPLMEDARVAKLSPRGKLDHVLLGR